MTFIKNDRPAPLATFALVGVPVTVERHPDGSRVVLRSGRVVWRETATPPEVWRGLMSLANLPVHE